MDRARPNELLPPGEREAIARIEAAYAAADLERAGAPSETDWAEAEHGSTAIRSRTRSSPDW